jgi:hypothetical protein
MPPPKLGHVAIDELARWWNWALLVLFDGRFG